MKTLLKSKSERGRKGGEKSQDMRRRTQRLFAKNKHVLTIMKMLESELV